MRCASALMVVLAATALQAGKKMHIHFSSGPDTVLAVADIDSIRFEETPCKPGVHGMVLVPARDSSFRMGSIARSNEQPVHTVLFTRDFWMDTTEVAQSEYLRLMAATYASFSLPSWGVCAKGESHPVCVNWFDAALYCNARTRSDGSCDTVYSYTAIEGTPGSDCLLFGLTIDHTASGYRLPTEAQWEYACRAGTTGDYYWDGANPGDFAWYNRNSDYSARPVAQKLPNRFGLYDMSGNVWEWCNDIYGSYADVNQTDPTGAVSDPNRVLRGGCWTRDASEIRSSVRGFDFADFADFGFRVCLPAR